MKREKILECLFSIIEDKIRLNNPLEESQNIFDDLGFDSLDTIEVIMECEQIFNVSISDDDVDRITTVKEIIDYLEIVIK